MTTKKVIISSKKNLLSKYGENLQALEKLFTNLITSDEKQNITTQLIYIDDSKSCSKAGIKAIKLITRPSAKKAVDVIFKKLNPAYIVLFGSQDIFPFQEIKNPANDDDEIIPSDLPYACDAPHSDNISTFTGPTRVVGRIPDVEGNPDMEYLKRIFETIIKSKRVESEKLLDYFAVTAEVWKKSTQQSLSNMFGNSTKLKISPNQNSPFSASDLKPLIHFYNCHGAPIDAKFYGQKGSDYPIAQNSPNVSEKVSPGTIVAAECCYGAMLFDPNNEGSHNPSMPTMYLKNSAVAFLGSSTIAYGPSSGNGLADLITQYFIKNIINGASTGRALLEARQQFLTATGPDLDPYELKTLAQFYLLGDPSNHPLKTTVSDSSADTKENRRLNLFNKGISLANSLAPCERVDSSQESLKKPLTNNVKMVFDQIGFTGEEKEIIYEVKGKNKKLNTFTKGMIAAKNVKFRAYIKKPEKINGISISDVLVLKENDNDLLGWKLYHSK